MSNQRAHLDATRPIDERIGLLPGRIDLHLGFDADDRDVEGRTELHGTKRPLPRDERVFFSEVAITNV